MKVGAPTHLLRGWRHASDTWTGAAVLGTACVAFALAGDPVTALLRYERAGLGDGELWRLIGAHLVHLGPGHTVMNVAALGILAFVLDGVVKPAAWLGAALGSALAIDAGLFWIDTDVEWYVGLSGVLHGLLALGGLELRPRNSIAGSVLLAAVAAKIAWEQWVGPLPMSEQTAGGDVVVSAHLFGALGGAAWFALRRSIHAARARPV